MKAKTKQTIKEIIGNMGLACGVPVPATHPSITAKYCNQFKWVKTKSFPYRKMIKR